MMSTTNNFTFLGVVTNRDFASPIRKSRVAIVQYRKKQRFEKHN